MDEQEKKQEAKAYEKYANHFMPKPRYLKNIVKAFVSGGLICAVSMIIRNYLVVMGAAEDDAGVYVTVGLIMTAQLLTGAGVFDSLGRIAGAGVIVPITGFANSMVAPAIEYKKEGIVLGVGAKLFSVAGPVLVCGITVSALIGAVYWLAGLVV